MGLNARLKVGISEEMDGKLKQLTDMFEVSRSILVRALLSSKIEEIIAMANDNKAEVEYSIEFRSNGREKIVKRAINGV